ncbi:hypothetical protein BpHYR1_030576 [Brachionus plicatilis]|uniref:Uncharacterized protein n=1 Tax=Brachionus plicatilis TaxID=10195 RepID=A0A3M7SRG5_BRAPC|nr:hypothetical protein BpHYR1_030576 [Brachionus plicatilis]
MKNKISIQKNKMEYSEVGKQLKDKIYLLTRFLPRYAVRDRREEETKITFQIIAKPSLCIDTSPGS